MAEYLPDGLTSLLHRAVLSDGRQYRFNNDFTGCAFLETLINVKVWKFN